MIMYEGFLTDPYVIRDTIFAVELKRYYMCMRRGVSARAYTRGIS